MKIKFTGSDEYLPDLTVGKVYTSEYEDAEHAEGKVVGIVDDVGHLEVLYWNEYEVVEV